MGIDVELKDDGTVELAMDDYITESVIAFGEKMAKRPPTPTTGNLFDVKESTELNDERSEIFHHIVVKLPYISNWVRVDISMTIAF